MELQVLPPFPGPIPATIPNPLGTAFVLTALALAGVGVGFGVAGQRKIRDHGRLLCESLETDTGIVPLVGVRTSYAGDWWEDRGRRLYRKARRGGQRTETGIARDIIAQDTQANRDCLAQFPPHPQTHPRNRDFWDSLVEHVRRELASEG